MFARGPLSFFLRRTFAVVVVLLLCGPSGECCGPGRRGGRRRSPRKLTPLVFKEHVPNVAETTLGASGLTEGHITIGDPRFHELVPNYNSDIYFRDEEGTGVDRLMTERCRERLNMLTISVMNTWESVRLRVLEGWDEGSRYHEQNSLHYEGRAVDISTTDKDRSKLGMLASLAVAAGFDWVYYESRSHVHCSVKSETSARRRLGGCFPTGAKVKTPNGVVDIGTLQEGDFIQVLREDGSLGFSPILLFIHKDADESRSFLQLGTSSGKELTLTPSHLVFVIRKELYIDGLQSDILQRAEGVLAGSVRPGDYLLTTVENSVILDRVIDFNASWRLGVFAPLTKDGTIVVNSVVASCYAVIDSQTIAHWAFLPVRWYYRVKDITLSLIPRLGITPDLNKKHTIPLYSKQKHKSSVHSMQMNYINVTEKYENPLTSIHTHYLENYTENEIKSNDQYSKMFPNCTKNYRKSLNSIRRSPKLLWNHSKKVPLLPKFHHQSHIHWYAKFLYEIAYWLLPTHLVYA